MKPDNWNRFAAGLLAILLCLCSFSMPAFASGTDPAPEPLPEIIEEEPTTGGMEPEGTNSVIVQYFLHQGLKYLNCCCRLVRITPKLSIFYEVL